MGRIRGVLLVAVGLLAAAPSPAQDVGAAPVLSRAQQEDFLRTAEIVSVRHIPKGVTRPRRATLTSGTLSHDAQLQDVDIFKLEFRPARGPREFNFHDSYKYNIAGYLLDDNPSAYRPSFRALGPARVRGRRHSSRRERGRLECKSVQTGLRRYTGSPPHSYD